MNTPTKFEIEKIIYSKWSPRIDLSYYPGKKAKRYNTFCLNQANNISIFYLNENKINKNYYKGKIIKYFL